MTAEATSSQASPSSTLQSTAESPSPWLKRAQSSSRLHCLARSASCTSITSSWTESSTAAGDADDEEVSASKTSPKASRQGPVEKWNGKVGSGFKLPTYQKTPEQIEKLREVLLSCILTQGLPKKEEKFILQSFRGPHHILPGMEVVRQGMSVDSDSAGLYILEQGQLSAFVTVDGSGHPGELVQAYNQPGHYFGELALVFKCPRSATVVADAQSLLWSLDGESFNHLLRDRYLDIRKRCRSCVLRMIPNITDEACDMISDGTTIRSFASGQLITRLRRKASAEDSTHEVFILETGHAVSSPSSSKIIAKRYAPMDMFGTPLQQMYPQAECDIIAGESPTVCVVLNVLAAELLLGSLKQFVPGVGEVSLSDSQVSSEATEIELPAARHFSHTGQDKEDGPLPSLSQSKRSSPPLPPSSSMWPFKFCCSRSSSCFRSTAADESEASCEAVPVFDNDKLHLPSQTK